MPKSVKGNRVVTVTVVGDEKAISELNRKETNVKNRLVDATNAGAEVFQKAISDAAPVDRGVLEENIETEVQKDTKRVAQTSAGPNKEAYYGMFVELGTKHQRANPFMQRSFEAVKDSAEDAAAAVIKSIITS